MAAFDRIVVEIEITEREAEALARVHSSQKLKEGDAKIFDGRFDKQYRALREVRLRELFRRGDERYREADPIGRSAIEMFSSLGEIEEMLDRVPHRESWEELVFWRHSGDRQ